MRSSRTGRAIAPRGCPRAPDNTTSSAASWCLSLGAREGIGGGMPTNAVTARPTYPGVYIEELPSSTRTISAVTTSVTAFVGHTRRGPLNEPVRVTGFAEFERRFGGLSSQSAVAYAVHQFFANGGSVA